MKAIMIVALLLVAGLLAWWGTQPDATPGAPPPVSDGGFEPDLQGQLNGDPSVVRREVTFPDSETALGHGVGSITDDNSLDTSEVVYDPIPEVTGDREVDLRNGAKWAIKHNFLYQGVGANIPSPPIEAVINNPRFNPDGKALDEAAREELGKLSIRLHEEASDLLRERLNLEAAAMIRAVDSGAVLTYTKPSEYADYRNRMEATYGQDGWIELATAIPGGWCDGTVIVYAVRANEPELLQANDALNSQSTQMHEEFRAFFRRVP